MSKVTQLIVVLAVAAVSFVVGVKSADTVKSHASWMFESKDEVALPDLSNEEIEGATSEEGVLSNEKVATPEAAESAAPAAVEPTKAPAEPVKK